jgi:hypothetical protein
MSDISIPTEAPDLDPLKLDTMTISANISQHFNLDVLARYTPLDDVIVGVHYRDIHRGSNEEDAEPADINVVEPNKSGRFKNQCTFVINDGSKVINTKLFNNGKIVNVGCMDPSQGVFTANILLQRFRGLNGFVKYSILKNLQDKNVKMLKKFFKDELRKKNRQLIHLLVSHIKLSTNLSCLDTNLSADVGFNMFTAECARDPKFVQDIMYIYTIISILKLYFSEQCLTERFPEARFQQLLKTILDHSDHEQGVIGYSFPGYIPDPDEPVFDEKTIQIALINKRTKCDYYINRSALQAILEQQPEIVQCDFDKNRFPGVIAQFRTPFGKVIKIFVFNTGKINITAAQTHEQIDAGYEFISRICKEHFHELLLKCEYHNKQKEYEDSFPDQHYVGVINNQSYYLLYKTRIVSNPRNVRCLHQLNLLDKYR